MIHITCNMGSRNLPDMYALSPRACDPRALGMHIRQIPPAHVATYTYALGPAYPCIPLGILYPLTIISSDDSFPIDGTILYNRNVSLIHMVM